MLLPGERHVDHEIEIDANDRVVRFVQRAARTEPGTSLDRACPKDDNEPWRHARWTAESPRETTNRRA